ncbi:MAG: hypothetical protein JXN65_01425 [Clostridia bacterium]|nr:hypothetical protein [Clostridia bacterium]
MNIERILEEIKIADVEPDEDLVRLTKLECSKAVRANKKAEIENKTKRERLTIRLLTSAAAVALVFVVLIVATVTNQRPLSGTAYYTIDINPSIGFYVDENNEVTDVILQNEDAKELYEGLDCVGMELQAAIKLIIEKALAGGYMTEEGKTYVLLGQFMGNTSSEDGEDILNHLLAGLQNDLGENVKLIGVNGDESYIEQAKELEVSPGILILCEMADDFEADKNLKVEDVIKNLPDDYIYEPEFKAPVIAVKNQDGDLVIKWGKIDFSYNLSGGAEVEYKLLKGSTLDEVKQMKNIVKTQKATVDSQITQFVVELSEAEMNTTMYYCLYVHSGNTSKLSNVIPVTLKNAEETTLMPTETPKVTPEPIDEEGASTISGGNIADGKITLNWTKVESERFAGYKVMYSYTDATPVYGEEGCYYFDYVTDSNKLSGTYKLSSMTGYKEGRKFYFSITVLYDDQSVKVPGNVISKTMPTTTTVLPTTTPAPDAYASTNISGYMDNGKIYLSWGKISDDRLEGYKVVYSFTDSTPEYDSSPYIRWITDASQTSTVINITELGSSSETRKCYFAITALYESHSVKKTGNTISFSIPPTASTDPYPSSTISGSMNGDTISLSWSQISDSRFDGYKVVYSFTDTTPAYSSSSYLRWITDASQTSTTINISELGTVEAAKPCYFSITALYDGQAVKIPGNAISFTIPATVVSEPLITPTLSSVYSSETDGNVYLSWSGDAASHSKFSYFKVIYNIDGTNRTINVGAAVSWAGLAANLEGYVEGTTTSGTFSVAAVYTTGDIKTSGSQSVNLYPPPA